MAQEPKVNILSPRSTRTQPSQKRALPPRHSFLTEAVEVALQKQQRKGRSCLWIDLKR